MLIHLGQRSSIIFYPLLGTFIYLYIMTILYVPNNKFVYFFTVTAHMKYNTTDYDYF